MSDRGIEARDVVPAYMRVTLALISKVVGRGSPRAHGSCTGWAQGFDKYCGFEEVELIRET
jgi:hypothetical protein